MLILFKKDNPEYQRIHSKIIVLACVETSAHLCFVLCRASFVETSTIPYNATRHNETNRIRKFSGSGFRTFTFSRNMTNVNNNFLSYKNKSILYLVDSITY